MNALRYLANPARAVQSALASLLALLVFFIATLTVCPGLHHWLHPDENGDDPACAVCSFAKGHASAPDVTVSVGPRVVCAAAPPLVEAFAPPAFSDYRVAPSRAPPVS
jgi:hypothetical protein